MALENPLRENKDKTAVIDLTSPVKNEGNDMETRAEEFRPTFHISHSKGAVKPIVFWQDPMEEMADRIIKAGDPLKEIDRNLNLYLHRQIQLLLPVAMCKAILRESWYANRLISLEHVWMEYITAPSTYEEKGVILATLGP